MEQEYFSLLNRKTASKSAELLNFANAEDKDYTSKFSNLRRQQDTIFVRNLARFLLSDITKNPFKTWHFIVNSNGARLAITKDGSPFHVSFSHSPNWFAVAVSPNPIGIDIEETKPTRPWQNMTDFLDLPDALPKFASEISFLKHWTASEALFKFRSAAQKSIVSRDYPYCVNTNTIVGMVTSSNEYPTYKNGAHLLERHSLKLLC